MATHDVSIVDRMQKRVVELVGGRIIRDELEASYVTSSIPLPRKQPEPQPESAPEVPAWARRGTARTSATTGHEAAAPAAPAEVRREPPAETGGQAATPSASGDPTGEVRVPIWARSDSGPVLLPGGDPSLAHAPWKAPPVAPPTPPADTEATSIFFAAPLPAPRPAWAAPEDGDATGTAGAPPADPGLDADEPAPVRPAQPWRAPTPEDRADARREVRTITGPIDLDNTGDPEGLARQTGKHRIVLPEHLDFVGGLGLRPPAPADDDDEVGPSS
jgi:cell division transport system ATP-binding protein